MVNKIPITTIRFCVLFFIVVFCIPVVSYPTTRNGLKSCSFIHRSDTKLSQKALCNKSNISTGKYELRRPALLFRHGLYGTQSTVENRLYRD